MTFRTYQLGGDFISVDLSQHAPPVAFDRFWDISEGAYRALYANAIPAIYPDDSLVVEGGAFPPP